MWLSYKDILYHTIIIIKAEKEGFEPSRRVNDLHP